MKIVRSKPRAKFTPTIRSLFKELNSKYRALFDGYLEFRKHPMEWSADRDKNRGIVNTWKVYQEKRSKEFDEINSLEKEFNKEWFKVCYGEGMEDVEKKALEGNKNSWLKLLRWDIEYLKHEKLLKLICDAYLLGSLPEEILPRESRDNKIVSQRFLEEVARVIADQSKFHKSTKVKALMWLMYNYEPEKTYENLLTAMQKDLPKEERFKEERHLRKLGLRKK